MNKLTGTKFLVLLNFLLLIPAFTWMSGQIVVLRAFQHEPWETFCNFYFKINLDNNRPHEDRIREWLGLRIEASNLLADPLDDYLTKEKDHKWSVDDMPSGFENVINNINIKYNFDLNESLE